MANRMLRLTSAFKRSQSSRAFSALNLQTVESNLSELKNGIRVVSEDIGGQTATVGVTLDLGSRHETEKTTGLSNLVLRCLLSRSHELERKGAFLSGSVGRDRTLVSVRCLSRDVPKAIQILGDLVSNPKFEEIEKQRKMILQEMQELDKNYESVVMNALHSTAFQNTPLALTPIGTTQVVSSLTTSDLQNHVNSHLKGPRMVFSAAGSVDHNQIVKGVEQHFGNVNNTYDNSEIPKEVICRYTGSDVRFRDDSMSLGHIVIAMEAPGFLTKDHLALLLCSNLIGSWDPTYGGGTDVTNYLGICSATEHLTHCFRSFNINYKEVGLWGVYLTAERMNQEDPLWHLMYEWKRFCTELSDSELQRAKNSVISQLMRQNETSYLVAQQIGNQVLDHGRRIPLSEISSLIQSLDAKYVRDVCTEYIWDRCPAIACIGPIEQLEDYENLRSKTYWWRY